MLNDRLELSFIIIISMKRQLLKISDTLDRIARQLTSVYQQSTSICHMGIHTGRLSSNCPNQKSCYMSLLSNSLPYQSRHLDRALLWFLHNSTNKSYILFFPSTNQILHSSSCNSCLLFVWSTAQIQSYRGLESRSPKDLTKFLPASFPRKLPPKLRPIS